MDDPVFSINDVRKPSGDDKHTLATKAVIHQVPDAETSLFKVKPGAP